LYRIILIIDDTVSMYKKLEKNKTNHRLKALSSHYRLFHNDSTLIITH